MNLRRIKHTLLRMTAEEKVIGIGALAILFGTFMPWYSVVMSFDKESMSQSGFSGDLGVIGFVIFLMSIITIVVLIGESMRLPLPQFGYKREQILFFFMGQSFFLTLLTIAIYTKRGLDFTEAGLRFGIYMVLIASFLGALSAFALIQKSRKKEVEDFFQHEAEEETEDTPRQGKTDGSEAKAEEEPAPEPEPEEPEQMFFEEEAGAMPDPESETGKKQEFSDYVPEDDMIEDVQEAPRQGETQPENQGDYLKRDAGLNQEEKGGGSSMNFYEDK
jgi:hypothetical protein